MIKITYSELQSYIEMARQIVAWADDLSLEAFNREGDDVLGDEFAEISAMAFDLKEKIHNLMDSKFLAIDFDE